MTPGRRPGPPRRGPPPRGPRPSRPVDPISQRAEELVRTAGLAPGIARQVAAGRLDLNDVLKRMAVADEVGRLIATHDINRALATQVVLGQAQLEDVLARRRLELHLAANRERSTLDAAAASGKELTLGVHGHRHLRGRVLRSDRYEIAFLDAESGTEQLIHKLQVKYAFDPEDFKKVKKALDYDKERRDRAAEPKPRPQDRFGCSDKRLGAAMDRKTPVVAVTLEGECFSGEVAWIARYEIGLRTRAGAEVAVFRHALDDFRDTPARRG